MHLRMARVLFCEHFFAGLRYVTLEASMMKGFAYCLAVFSFENGVSGVLSFCKFASPFLGVTSVVMGQIWLGRGLYKWLAWVHMGVMGIGVVNEMLMKC
jgi:hypothetical protein